MSNPQMPGVGVMSDTLEFVKNLWGSMSVPGMSVPGMVVPTMSVQDLDKKISDLKAVESWLNLNVSMLHGSIQALEVQRATISTLQSMGSAMAAALKHPEGKGAASLFESVPYASAFFAGTQAAPAPNKHDSAPPAAPPAAPAAPSPAATAAAPAATEAAAKPAAWAGDFAAQAGNPTLWWNILQDQFKQAVSTAISSDGNAKPAAAAGPKAGAAPATVTGKTTAASRPAANNSQTARTQPGTGTAKPRSKAAAVTPAGNTSAATPKNGSKT